MDAMDMASSEHKLLRVSHLMPQYEQYHGAAGGDSGEDTEGDPE